jgi:type IX secretion system PorP/SprF family membrane protein
MSCRIKYFICLKVAILIVVLFPGKAISQEKTVYTQYMFNMLAINPAYAGSQNILNATAYYRKQWVGLDGAPNTQTFSVHSATKKKKIGIGVFAMRDGIGVHSELNFYTCYAYKIKLSRKSILSMGLQAGFNNLSSNYRSLTLVDPNDPNFSDKTKFSPNVGAGLYYYLANKAYIGFSVPYMIKNRVLPKSINSFGKQARYYFLSAGYVMNLNQDVKVKPSTLLRYEEGAPLGFDLNANFILKEVVNIGGSYRSGDSMSLLLMLQLTPRWQLGYAYDFTTSGLNRFTQGSHEILLNYRINLFPEKCATYF